MVDLVWLNKAYIPHFSSLGSLEVLYLYFPGWGGGGVGDLTETELGKNGHRVKTQIFYDYFFVR